MDKNRLFVIFIILIASIPYIGLLNNYFLSDDFGLVYSISKTSSILGVFKPTSSFLRPFQYLVVYLQYPFFGNNPALYHLTNMFCHVLSAVLVYLLLIKIGINKALSFLGAVLFSIHWTHVETVAWICVFAEILYIIFILCSIVIYTSYVDSKRNGYYLFSLWFFVIAFFTVEKSILLLPIITVYDFIFNYKREEGNLNKIVFRIIPFCVVGLLCVLFRTWVIGSTGITNKAGGYSLNLFNAKFINNFIRALEYLIIPFNILNTEFYGNTIVLVQKYINIYLCAVLALIGFILGILLLRRKYGHGEKIILFGIIWTGITILFFSFFAIAQRYMFIVSIGYSILLSGVLMCLFESKFMQKRFFRQGIIFMFIFYLGLQLISNLKVQDVFEKGSQFSKEIVTELHEVTRDIPEDHMVFFINPPATLSSENGIVSVDVFRFGYKSALKLIFGNSPIVVRNGIDFGDRQSISSTVDVLNFETLIENDSYWKKLIPERRKRHFVTYSDGHVRYVTDINGFNWSKTGWRYVLNNNGSISLQKYN